MFSQSGSTDLEEKKETNNQKTTVRAYDMDECVLPKLPKSCLNQYLSYDDFIEKREPFLQAEIKAIQEGGFNEVILALFTTRQSHHHDSTYYYQDGDTFAPILFYIQQYYQKELGNNVKVIVDLSFYADTLAKPTSQLGDGYKRMLREYYLGEKIDPKEHPPQIADGYKLFYFYNILHRTCITYQQPHFAFFDNSSNTWVSVIKCLKLFSKEFPTLLPKCSIDFIPSIDGAFDYSGETGSSIVGTGKTDRHYAWSCRYFSMIALAYAYPNITIPKNAKELSEAYLNFDFNTIKGTYPNFDIGSLNKFEKFRETEIQTLEPCLTQPTYMTYDELIQNNILSERGFSPNILTTCEKDHIETSIRTCFHLPEDKKKPICIKVTNNQTREITLTMPDANMLRELLKQAGINKFYRVSTDNKPQLEYKKISHQMQSEFHKTQSHSVSLSRKEVEELMEFLNLHKEIAIENNKKCIIL